MDTNLENYPSENIEREHLIRSQKIMIKANIILKESFEEFHRMMPGNEELNKKFRLSAKGDGKAILVGDFTLNLHLENGNLTILNPPKDIEREATRLKRKKMFIIKCWYIIYVMLT